MKALDQEATDAGKTIVLHLVVEGEDGSVGRRRLLSRRLEDEGEGEDGENNGEDGGENQNENADGNNNNANNVQQNNGYYGYVYYNSNGELVSTLLV